MSAIPLLFSLITLFGFCCAIAFAFRLLCGSGDTGAQENETKLMQELHQSALRMEKRIEALETIMLERADRVEAGTV
jgi:phage shock protein B